ncbi:MAG: hypothetical protein M1834_000308 [Cirrosporium novae-zelandiae]|nr:MAG: hypothetical protein M1834_000308 [Cirrosporium novae-zelandiae]
MDWWEFSKSFLYYLMLPILTILKWSLFVTRLVVAPFLYIIRGTFNIPIRIFNFLDRFEAFFIYIGVAITAGIIAAVIIHYSSTFMVVAFNLQSEPEPASGHRGRSIESYRTMREKKKPNESPAPSLAHEPLKPELTTSEILEMVENSGVSGQHGLLSTAILEEESDSDYGL